MSQRPDETSQIEASLRDPVETTTNGTRHFGKRAERYARGVWDCGMKRGVLFVLTQMPMIAFLVGIAFKWMGYPLITVFTVIAAFIVLPIWVSYRRDRSADPGEPAHDFVKLAMWALVPYVVYNIARVPAYYLLKVVFWDHWYAFGSTLTGEPPDHWASLLSGTFIHSLQGYVLVLGYYVLFGRGTLRSALLYVFVFLSAIYSSVFPLFILIDFKAGPAWYFMVWWAHFWMALAVYAVPRLYVPGLWRRLRGRVTRPGVTALLILVYFSPLLFVFWRAATWQYPLQGKIDQALFEKTRIGLKEDAVLTAKSPSAPEEVLYQMRLRVGPRIYQDYIKATNLCVEADQRYVDLVRLGRFLLCPRYCPGESEDHTRALEVPRRSSTDGLHRRSGRLRRLCCRRRSPESGLRGSHGRGSMDRGSDSYWRPQQKAPHFRWSWRAGHHLGDFRAEPAETGPRDRKPRADHLLAASSRRSWDQGLWGLMTQEGRSGDKHFQNDTRTGLAGHGPN